MAYKIKLNDTKNNFICIIEVGVLIDSNKYSSLRNSYKKLHDEGLLEDENVAFTQDLNKAKRYIEKYVRNGVQGTYGVISIGKIEDDLILEERNGLLYGEDGFEESELENYLLENYFYEKNNCIIFSVYKDKYSIDYNTFE
jgi:hypothetical protein